MVRAVLAALFIALGGCTNDTVKKVEALAEQACDCRDPACADQVDAAYLELVKQKPRGSQDDREEVQAVFDRMRECLAAARKPADPGTGAADGASGPTRSAEEAK